jgi:hypothetical protein
VKSLLRPLTAFGVALLLSGVAPAPADASPATLKRSIENLTLFPIDLVLSPVVAGRTVVRNLQDVDDSELVRIVYPIPGFAWVTTVQIGAAVLRGVTGAFELLPGIGLFFFDADLDPLFDPADENEALVDFETPIYHVRFGIDYTSGAY